MVTGRNLRRLILGAMLLWRTFVTITVVCHTLGNPRAFARKSCVKLRKRNRPDSRRPVERWGTVMQPRCSLASEPVGRQ